MLNDAFIFLLYYFYTLYLFINELLKYGRNYKYVTLFGA